MTIGFQRFSDTNGSVGSTKVLRVEVWFGQRLIFWDGNIHSTHTLRLKLSGGSKHMYIMTHG